ncbi:TldD/PmbA family protein [candidate division WOR-3 bacterium]|nr:TldD/PmbA family protein [candidate division WOR-3 bacterium]
MFERLDRMLGLVRADYADLRCELARETSIDFSGRELTGLSASSTDGFVWRVLKNGAWSQVSFTKPEDAERAARSAVENAELLARGGARPVRLAPSPAVRDEYRPKLNEDPRPVPTEAKLELLRRYNDIALANPKVATTQTGYWDMTRDKYFVSTDGARLREELVTVRISGEIVTKEGNLTQRVRFGFGGSDGLARLRNREAEMADRVRICVDLLKAEPVRAGEYRAVLDQSLAGVFTHEAFGHFSEADIIEDNPTMREKMKIGAKLGSDVLSITDDPTRPDQLGFYRYDDEGVAARRVALMTDGVLTGRLHSRRTAAEYGEPISGHCVAQDYRFAPIIRMGCIFIEPRDKTKDELLDRLGDGLYLCNHMGGATIGENFTFGAQFGYEVKGGKPGRMLRDINISGNLYATMKNLTAVANDLTLREVGGCGKGQMNFRSCNGAPHVLVENVVVGGR